MPSLNILNKKLMKKNTYIIAIICFLTLCLTGCSNDDYVETPPAVKETVSLSKLAPNKAIEVFNNYATTAKQMNIPDNRDAFDFERAVVSYSATKNAYVYMVPLKGEVSSDSLLVGIGDENGISVQLYMGKDKNTGLYRMYNENHEPIYDINFNTSSKLTKVETLYGNDATIIELPSTRAKRGAVSRHTWSVVCNTAFIAGGAALAYIGALPTLGASIGFGVCAGVAAAALC